MVDAAEALERAVGAPAGQVAGPVEPGARLSRERVGEEALGRQRRAGHDSRAPGRRRRCTARRSRPPARPAAACPGRRVASRRWAGRSRSARRPAPPATPTTRPSSRSGRRRSTGLCPCSSRRSARARGIASPPQSIVSPGLPAQPDSSSSRQVAGVAWRKVMPGASRRSDELGTRRRRPAARPARRARRR